MTWYPWWRPEKTIGVANNLNLEQEQMRSVWIVLFVSFLMTSAVWAKAVPEDNPGCEHHTVQECLSLALTAMGGRERLQEVKSARLESIGHTLLMEQSYRQAPFITSYERTTETFDFVNRRMLTESRLTWPEADDNQAESSSTVAVVPEGGVTRAKDGDHPCSRASIDEAR